MPTASLRKLSISNEIRNDPSLSALVKRAIDYLIEQLGRSAGTVEVCWTTHTDEVKRLIVRLSLADCTGSVSADFSESKLSDVPNLRRRLVRLWGDLLQIRSHRQLEKLHAVVQNLSDD